MGYDRCMDGNTDNRDIDSNRFRMVNQETEKDDRKQGIFGWKDRIVPQYEVW